MTDKEFNVKWATAVERSNDFTDLRPFASLLCYLFHLKDGQTYMLMVQDKLYSHGLLPFKVENIEDAKHRVADMEKMQPNDSVFQVLSYIYLSFLI